MTSRLKVINYSSQIAAAAQWISVDDAISISIYLNLKEKGLYHVFTLKLYLFSTLVLKYILHYSKTWIIILIPFYPKSRIAKKKIIYVSNRQKNFKYQSVKTN